MDGIVIKAYSLGRVRERGLPGRVLVAAGWKGWRDVGDGEFSGWWCVARSPA